MKYKILIMIISISALVSGLVLYDRHKAESRMNNVEIAIDMNDFQNLAGEAGMSFDTLAQQLINHGATSIAVHEATLDGLKDQGRIAYMSLSNLLADYYSTGTRIPVVEELVSRYGEIIEKREAGNYSIVITRDKFLADFLYSALYKRTGGNIERIDKDDSYAVVVKQRLRNLNAVGLGFLERDLSYAKSQGFVNLIPRMQNYQGIDEKGIDSKIAQVKRPEYGVSTVIFAGDTVLGYDAAHEEDPYMLKYAAKRFHENGLITAILEKPAEEDINKVQRGISTFSKASLYSSTKVYSIEFMDTRKTLDPRNVVEQWSRAVAERNVRIIYVRPILNPHKGPVENLNDTLEAIDSIAERTKQMGFTRYTVKGLGTTYPNSFERFIIFTGILAGGVLLLLSLVPLKNYLIYGALGVCVLGSSGLLLLDIYYNIFNTTIGDLTIKSAALAAAIIFPSLAASYLIAVYKKHSRLEEKITLPKVILKSILTLIIAAGIALVGGLFVASLLAESKYILKLDIFRGVKLAFISPLIIFIAIYIKNIGIYIDKDDNPINLWLQLKKLLNTSVTVKYVLAGAVVIIGLMVLILRSGNAPAGFSLDIERELRSFLETIFIARPRSKELLAFPILMLLVYASVRRYKMISFFIMLAGVIGLADIVNTFSHIRMSLEMAALSTAYSLMFGILTGTILIVLLNFVEQRFMEFIGARRETH